MIRVLLTSIGLLAAASVWASAWSDQPRGQPRAESGAPAQGQSLGTSVPQSGVIRPDPGATVDNSITPPNVDPKMQIPPPVGAGSGTKIDPK